jgi:AcrR family transcriptional regulator
MGRRPFVREQILESAFDLIAKEGYEAVTTRDIAKAAKVGSASMFKHFPTKEDLGRELYRVALAPLLKDFAQLAAKKPAPAEAVRETVRLLYAAYDHRPRALALLVFPPHVFTPDEVDRGNRDSVRAILQRLIGADEDLAAIVWGAITGPLQDRYLRRRTGLMSPAAELHAKRIVKLVATTASGARS